MSPKETPYDYQTLVREQFLGGQDLIIQAPTGAGKTRAALEPGIRGFQLKPIENYPQRLIYNVPMRVLARGFLDEYGKRAKEKGWLPHWHPTIQTGDMPEDPMFEGHVVFATVDQMLAGFLNIPYGLPKRLDNINAGAMIGSALVFDEFHLYPRDQMMLTTVAMLKMLKGVSRFILMSATFSPVFLREIGRVIGAEVIADDPDTPLDRGLFHDIPALTTRQRTFYAEDGALDARAVIERIDGTQRVLCICNTVDRAQRLYRDLKSALGEDMNCRLLHSRFYREDRQAVEDFAREQFGKEESAGRTVLVATQVIEVGLDISSEVMFTECAPAASLIQRAGRCARWEGEGRVFVFQPYDEGEINYAPYTDDDQEDICRKTWNALRSEAFNGQIMGFSEEQQLVKIAHEEADEKFVTNLEANINQRIDHIAHCMASREGAWADRLIRERKVNTVPLYIHPRPDEDEILTTRPWQREAITLSKGQIERALAGMPEPEDIDAPFLFCAGTDQTVDDYTSLYKWNGLRESKEVYAARMLVAHPQAVTYTADLGLMLSPGSTPAKESPVSPRRDVEKIAYEAERYHEHLNGLQLAYTMRRTAEKRIGGESRERAYTPLHDEVLYPLRGLCARVDADFAQTERLLRLTLALHDVGKLNLPWQAWSRAWQNYRRSQRFPVTLPTNDPDPLAHTDFDGARADERELQQGFKHAARGNHAGESAEACLPVLWDATGGDAFWMAVTVGAIMRHHTPDVKDAGAFRLTPGSEASFRRALEIFGFGDEAERWFEALCASFARGSSALSKYAERIAPSRSSYNAALMYFVFVRTLRLADQRSGNYWRQYRTSNLVSGYER